MMTSSSSKRDSRHELFAEELIVREIECDNVSARRSVVAAHVAIFTANVLFGVGNVVGKIGLDGTNPILFALVREAISGPLLVLFACVVQSGSIHVDRDDWWRFLLTGMSLFGTNFCYILGLKLAGETSASMWQPAQPLFITLMAICIGIESPTVLKFVGIFIAAGGCMFVSLWDPKADGGTNELAGNTLFFVQSLCCATFYVSEKPLLQKYDPVATVGVAYIIATFFMAATAVVVNNVHSALHFFCEDCGDSGWTIPTDAWWAIAYWIFGGSIAGYLLNTWGNKRVDASIVGIYAVIQPVVTVACASIVIALSSAPHWGLDGLSFADIGAIGIILGLLIVVCDNIRRRRSVATSGKHHRLLGEALLDVESSVAE